MAVTLAAAHSIIVWRTRIVMPEQGAAILGGREEMNHVIDRFQMMIPHRARLTTTSTPLDYFRS